jgi:hypothetical protein
MLLEKQKRLPKFKRTPEAVGNRQVTETSLAIMDTIERYQMIPTSLLIRLVPGNQRVTQLHLQRLYHKGLINRFCFMKGRTPGEFHYYLDNVQALYHLTENGVDPDSLDFEGVRRNKEKRYCDINDPIKSDELAGTLLFLKHEAMISRFHGMLEIACNNSVSKVELTDWQQGPELWNKVEAPKINYRDGEWRTEENLETLPHRPDAFFKIAITEEDERRRESAFFYEADRKTANTTRFIKKLRAHFHYIVNHKHHQEHYGITRIRAVLTETLDTSWAENLRQAAAHPVVSGKPSPLFWFTASDVFTKPVEITQGKTNPRTRLIPRFLMYPEMILEKRWLSSVDSTIFSLLD